MQAARVPPPEAEGASRARSASSAVPFGEPTTEASLETPQNQRFLALLDQTATLRSVMLLTGPNGVGKSASSDAG